MTQDGKKLPQYRRPLDTIINKEKSVPVTKASVDSMYDWLLYLLDFTGRCGILEFVGLSFLFAVIILLPAGLFILLHLDKFALLWANVTSLILFIPNIALMARRLHDTGKSAAFLIIAFLPVAGAIILLIMLLLPGDDSANNPYKTKTHF